MACVYWHSGGEEYRSQESGVRISDFGLRIADLGKLGTPNTALALTTDTGTAPTESDFLVKKSENLAGIW
jgi:hypothetical protein